MSSKLRIIVSGMAGAMPIGGVAWMYLQYAVGFARLGHDVYYHEDTWMWPFDPVQNTNTSDPDYSVRFLQAFVDEHAPDLADRWHYLHLHEDSYGMTRSAFDEVAKSADLFLNVSGTSFIPDSLGPACTAVFIDTDPGYNQIVYEERPGWSENIDRWCGGVDAHDKHFTFGENILDEDCAVPAVGINWLATRPPVVLSMWDTAAQTAPAASAPWTTVMTWNDFKGPVTYRGTEYHSKGAEMTKFIGLPSHSSVPLSIAMGGIGAPMQQLEENGWKVVDGPSVTLTPDDYQRWLRNSRGEVSTAKHIYVALNTGWFSDRTACYLAAGRPCVVQETGFSKRIATGDGLFSFNTMDEAVAAIENVEARYEHHARAARQLAEAEFEASRVLNELIDAAGASHAQSRAG